jgi:hypothetical protein
MNHQPEKFGKIGIPPMISILSSDIVVVKIYLFIYLSIHLYVKRPIRTLLHTYNHPHHHHHHRRRRRHNHHDLFIIATIIIIITSVNSCGLG